ncbi:transposase [Streptomyces sp. SD15]
MSTRPSAEQCSGTTTGGSSLIDEIVRDGAGRMLAAALEAKVNSYIAELADQRDFVPALEQFLGSSAGLSPATVARLTQQSQADHKVFGERDLSATDYVYVWADGIHLRIRLAIQDIYNAEDKEHAAKAVATLAKQYGATFPKAVKKIVDDEDELLAFYDFWAEHWIHLRTTNPIESTFATVRLRTKVTKGAGSRAAALAMVFKLVESAQARWRAVNAPHLVALVRAGARFERGQIIERPEAPAA